MYLSGDFQSTVHEHWTIYCFGIDGTGLAVLAEVSASMAAIIGL